MNNLKLLFVLLIGLSLQNCSDSEYTDSDSEHLLTKRSDGNYQATQKEALHFASLKLGIEHPESSLSLVSSRALPQKSITPLVYIFNFEDGESKYFAIISGDKREHPILAYGDNEFSLDEIGHTGAVIILDEYMQAIQHIRSNNISKVANIAIWTNSQLPVQNKDIVDDDGVDPVDGDGPTYWDCERRWEVNQCGPLLDTRWGQGCVYNEFCPANCTSNCQHTYTGCVATGMAQVINYFQQPSSYDYSLLKPRYFLADTGTPEGDEVAQLMYDCGESVDMDWDCDGSGASRKDVNNALKDDFGFSDGGEEKAYEFNDYHKVRRNVCVDGKPIMFAGCANKNNYLIFSTYNDCHLWVCDGYKTKELKCYKDDGQVATLYVEYREFYMNWGWDGSANGWYKYNDWGSFNHNKDIIYDIEP